MGYSFGSGSIPGVVLAASALVLSNATAPTFLKNRGFLPAIVRIAAGHYQITLAAALVQPDIQVSVGYVAATAATPLTTSFNYTPSTGVIDLYIDLNTAGTGAFVDSGAVSVKVWDYLPG